MSLQSRLADVLQAIGLDIKALFQAVEAGDAIVDQSGQPLLDQADAPVVANTKQVLASTDDLAEGEQHLYFTDDRARAAAPIQSLVAGTNVSIDTTDPENPVISATGGGGGPGRTLKQQVFTRSGTFTPSKALLDAGGAVEVFLVGGGGGGARGSFSNEEFQRGGGGGAGGSITQRVVIVGGAIEVTIGAGGRRGDLSQSAGTGGTSRFGAALYAAGGGSGLPL